MVDANKIEAVQAKLAAFKKAELAIMFFIKQVQLCQLTFVYSGNMYALCMVRTVVCHHNPQSYYHLFHTGLLAGVSSIMGL